MAVEQTVVTPNPAIFGFQGMPDIVGEQSIVPRGEVVFSVIGGIVAATGVGDSQLLTVGCSLPVNFAYALLEVACELQGADAVDWDVASLSRWQDDNALPPTGSQSIRIPVQGLSHGIVQSATPSRLWTYGTIPNQIIIPKQGFAAGVSMANNFTNGNLQGSSMVFDFYARFLMYDVAQAHHWQANTPTPIR